MLGRAKIWLVVVPWLVIAIYAAIAVAEDYGRFQQDKSQQIDGLLSLQEELTSLLDSWEQQGVTVFEQFREAVERRSIEEQMNKLEAKTRAAKDHANDLRHAQFFPRTVDAAYSVVDKLTELAATVRSAFGAKVELIEVRQALKEAPARVQQYRDRVLYWSSRDILNYYFAQEALAQSESNYRELLLLREQLERELDLWRDQFDRQRLACADSIEQMGDNAALESETDYLSYLLARLRTFNPRRAAGF